MRQKTQGSARRSRREALQHKTIPRFGGRLAAVVVALSIGAAVVPAGASATYTWWRTGSLGAYASDADVTRTALTSSRAYADYGRYIQAAAHWAGGWSLYGNYVQGLNEACQNYPGYHLGALIRNPHSVSQNDVWALSGWVENGVPSYC